MQVIEKLENFPSLEYAVVTSGTFDGVHVGHKTILERLKKIAKDQKGETVVITFWPHPRIVLHKDSNDLKLLTTIEEKTQLLAKEGIDYLLILPFSKEFANLSPAQFVQKVYIDALNTKKLVIGYDHRFGKNREGGLEYLQANAFEYDFTIEEIPQKEIDEIGISSTKIREALLKGNLDIANQFLDRPYNLTGQVVHGDKIGRTIGYPTANIEIEESYKLVPQNGIYAVRVSLEHKKSLPAMLYIGYRPTLHNPIPQQRIEVYIFDFNEDIYNQKISIEFIKKIREDMKFDSLQTMQKQLDKDAIMAKKVL